MKTIAEMQEAIRNKGFQWIEHVFNDGHPNDCIIYLTKSKDGHYFGKHQCGDIGWGRYRRQAAWEMAFQTIVVEGKYD